MRRRAAGRRGRAATLSAALGLLAAGCAGGAPPDQASAPGGPGFDAEFGLGVGRLEDREGGCLAGLTLLNGLDRTLDAFAVRFSVYHQGRDEGAAAAVWRAVDPGRAVEAPVRLPVACDRVDGIVIREVSRCEAGGAPEAACLDRIYVSPDTVRPLSTL